MSDQTDQTRPIFLNLFQLHFPITAIVSILHRVSGVLLFLTMPVLWFALAAARTNISSYYHLVYLMSDCFIFQFIIWIALSSLAFHAVFGVRHLLGDANIAHSFKAAERSAWGFLLIAAGAIGWLAFKVLL